MRFLAVAMALFACGDDASVGVSDAAVDGADAASDAAVDAVGACVGMPEATPCDADGNGCTMDLCRRGVCVLGGEADCNDGVSCTTDRCTSTGPSTFSCIHEVSGGCAIEGVCIADGAPNPDDSCQRCDDSAPTQWTDSTGTCDDGDACTMDDQCGDGGCAGTPILDAFESNDTRASAHRLPEVSDRDPFTEAEVLNATIFPDADVDWFVYLDTDNLIGSIFPRVELRDIPAGSNYDLCVFIDCESEFDSVDCEFGTEQTRDGLTGCCSASDGNADEIIRIDHNCRGTNDSADVFVEVVRVSGTASCEAPYSLKYGDD